jgi:hypothetical protein
MSSVEWPRRAMVAAQVMMAGDGRKQDYDGVIRARVPARPGGGGSGHNSRRSPQ